MVGAGAGASAGVAAAAGTWMGGVAGGPMDRCANEGTSSDICSTPSLCGARSAGSDGAVLDDVDDDRDAGRPWSAGPGADALRGSCCCAARAGPASSPVPSSRRPASGAGAARTWIGPPTARATTRLGGAATLPKFINCCKRTARLVGTDDAAGLTEEAVAGREGRTVGAPVSAIATTLRFGFFLATATSPPPWCGTKGGSSLAASAAAATERSAAAVWTATAGAVVAGRSDGAADRRGVPACSTGSWKAMSFRSPRSVWTTCSRPESMSSACAA